VLEEGSSHANVFRLQVSSLTPATSVFIGLFFRAAVFSEEHEEAAQGGTDHLLVKTCQAEIDRHCSNAVGSSLLTCLRENMKEDKDFDLECKRIVVRRIVQHSRDYRLNPQLQRACKLDLPKFCSQHIVHHEGAERMFLEGKVIECLKDVFTSDQEKLTHSCRRKLKVNTSHLICLLRPSGKHLGAIKGGHHGEPHASRQLPERHQALQKSDESSKGD